MRRRQQWHKRQKQQLLAVVHTKANLPRFLEGVVVAWRARVSETCLLVVVRTQNAAWLLLLCCRRDIVLGRGNKKK